ncbi:hypothetical protein ADK47_21230, partial [Streptomyces rimosus subsp. rimosus]
PRAREAASALFVGVFNAAIALGAFGGGRAVDGGGLTGVLWLGGGVSVGGGGGSRDQRLSSRQRATNDDCAGRWVFPTLGT